MKTPFLKILLSAIAILFVSSSYAGGDPTACPGAKHRNRGYSKEINRNRSDYSCQRNNKGSKVKHHKAKKNYYH